MVQITSRLPAQCLCDTNAAVADPEAVWFLQIATHLPVRCLCNLHTAAAVSKGCAVGTDCHPFAGALPVRSAHCCIRPAVSKHMRHHAQQLCGWYRSPPACQHAACVLNIAFVLDAADVLTAVLSGGLCWGPAVELRGGARQHCAGAAVLACVLDCTMVVHASYGPCGRHRCCRPPARNACLCVGLCSQLPQQTWRNKLSLVTPTELSCSSLHAEAPLRKLWQCPT